MDITPIDNVESTIPIVIPDLEHKTDDVNHESAGSEVESKQEESKQEEETLAAGLEKSVKGEEVSGTGEDRPAEDAQVESSLGAEEVQGVEQPESVTEIREPEETQKEEGDSSVTVDGHDVTDDGQSSEIVRTATPGSRTSTPPPGTVHPTAPKKFSAVNVTKKFLSKTSQPAVAPAAGSKLGLNASPVPISTPSRLLSTKLTTAPLAKSSASPNPPAAGVTPTSSASPWAKPALLSDASASESSSLAQPAPKRSLANLAASIGQGQGLTATKPVAWKAVQSEGRSRFGMSRDFPTAREIADGESRLGREMAESKMQAQLAAQQHAAHNQALLKSLNAFTNVDSAHRWDDDDDEDIIDFGDKLYLPTAPPPDPEAPPKPAQYVAADDFDRSWPRKAPVEVSRRTDEPRDRVLFNASSNRLEPSLPRQNAPPPPTRLMSRNSSGAISGPEPPARAPSSDRPLPPHQQNPPPPPGQRALPPHMAGMPDSRQSLQSTGQSSTGRPGWGAPRDLGRSTQPAGYSDQQHPRPSSLSPVKSATALPSRPTWEQQANAQAATHPHRGPAQQAAQPTSGPAVQPTPIQPAVPTVSVDEQTAEMHTAADRARLRRLAEEAEREAAMERARKKAKELEERLGLKPAAPAPAPVVPVAPTQVSPPVQIQPALLRRPVPALAPASAPAPPPGLPSTSAVSTLPPLLNTAPAAPKADPSRQVESSWRSRPVPTTTDMPRPTPPAETTTEKPVSVQPRTESLPQAPTHIRSSSISQTAPPREQQPVVNVALPVAAALVEAVVRLPGQAIVPEVEQPAGKKESGFDSMLARIQAAMVEARLAPPSISELVATQPPSYPSSAPTAASQTTRAQLPLPAPAPSRPTEIFDVTQVPPPRSPPPAWRTYSVRLPSSSSAPAKSPISPSRLKDGENPISHPQGWLLVFQPPLDLPSHTILADHLLPRPIYQARFGRTVDAAPIVSISPRKLEPFERKRKKTSAQPAQSLLSEVMQPPSTAENLIAPSSSKYAWQQNDRTTTVASGSTPGQSSWTEVTLPAESSVQPSPPAVASDKEVVSNHQVEVASTAEAAGPSKKLRSPSKTSPAEQAVKDGQFVQEGVAVPVGPIARSKPVDNKSGVRFMVSSELEGDSLLDEVNKMSLETVGEGWGGDEKVDQSVPKTPGSETPKTPPSLNSGQPASPSGPGTPWSRSTPRGATQHDHLKSVWDQAGSTDAASSRTAAVPTDLPLPPPLISIPSTQSAQSDASTPMYPSLNAPSSSEPIPSQPLPANKLGYPAPPSAFSPVPTSAHNVFMRPAIGAHGYMFHAPSPTDSAENYGSLAGRPNGGFSAPWSPAAFGASMTSPGYGYAGKHVPQHQPSPVEQKDMANHYGFSPAALSQQQGYGQAYGQQTQHQMGANAYARGAGAGTYAYGGYGQQGVAGGAGAAGTRAAGRFGPHAHAHAQAQAQAQANGDYGQVQAYGVEGAGYYGGIGSQQQHPRQHVGHSPVYGQAPHQLPHNNAQQQHQQPPGQGYSAGAVGQQIMRGGRKMW